MLKYRFDSFHPSLVLSNGPYSNKGAVLIGVVSIGPLAMVEKKDLINEVCCPLGRRSHRVYPPIVTALTSLKLLGQTTLNKASETKSVLLLSKNGKRVGVDAKIIKTTRHAFLSETAEVAQNQRD